MKDLVTVVSCDWCYHASEGVDKVSATTTPPLTIGPRIRTLDLCEVHQTALNKARELVKSKGVPLAKTNDNRLVMDRPLPVGSGKFPVNAEGQRQCPFCLKMLARGSMVGHILDVHGDGSRPNDTECPDCDHVAPSWHRLAIHRTKAHNNYDGITEAINYVKGLTPGGRSDQLPL